MTDMIFSPLKIGNLVLQHRVVMAPLTRYRCPNHLPNELVVEYYSQRASAGGLQLTEAQHISERAGNNPETPRIDLPEAIESWSKVTKAVHQKGGYIFCQLNHTGRCGLPQFMSDQPPLSSSPIALTGTPRNYPEGVEELKFVVPKEMTKEDMDTVVVEFVRAAENAIEAGFDGIEIHGANGYLIDQFLNDNINVRTDEFGGNIVNRAKFPLRVVEAVCDAIGSEKVGIRLSPWGSFNDTNDSDPAEHWSYVAEKLDALGLAYVHIIEPRSDTNGGSENDNDSSKTSKLIKLAETKNISYEQVGTLKPLRSALKNTPLISAGGWNQSNYQGVISKGDVDALTFGRWFISNPDLPERLKLGISLTPYDRTTFYKHGTPVGYITYRFRENSDRNSQPYSVAV